MKTMFLAMVAVVAAFSLSGCYARAGTYPDRDDRRIDSGRYDRDGYRYNQGHVHRAGCGHEYRGGVWVTIR